MKIVIEISKKEKQQIAKILKYGYFSEPPPPWLKKLNNIFKTVKPILEQIVKK